ncbi:hypothetical protein [Tahibacter caeni]|uniref:hypothetical protein n=1 Tax=Tahibacter caeni TaxID=1453545 RepID=UPI002147F72F|nr:hypothetical protein [Tahibacter caeni]
MHRPQHPASGRVGRLSVLLSCSLLASAAAASNWDQTLTASGSAAAQVVDVAAVPGARWLLLQRGDETVLQREAGGQLTVATTTAASSRLIAMPDGGVLLAETDAGRLRRYDAQGRPVWQRDAATLLVLPDAAGGSWVETLDDFQRLAADGSLRVRLSRNAFPVLARTVADEPAPLRYQRPQRAVDTASGDLLVAGRSSVTASQGSAQLARFDRQGRQRWAWTDAGAQPGLEFSAVAVSGELSCAAARESDGSTVVRLCLDNAGRQRWIATQQLGPNSATAVVALGADGSLYALDTINRSNAQLALLGPDGAPRWTQPLPAGIADACEGPGAGCSLQVAANGDATVLTSVPSGTAQRLRLLGFGADGSLRYDRELPVSVVSSLARESNGHVLLVGTRQAGARRLVELDAQGSVLSEVGDLPTPLRPKARAVAGNALGDSFIVSAADGAGSYRVRRVTADGNVAWDVEIPGSFDLAQATASDDRVCISEVQAVQGEPNNRVRCLAAGDGRTLWSRPIEEPLNFRSRTPLPASTFRLREDNALVLSYLYNGVQLYGAAGTSQRHYPTTERTPLGDFNDRGDAIVVERPASEPSTSDQGELILRSNTAREVYRLDLAALGIQPQQLRLDDEDNAYIVGSATQSSSTMYAWMLDRDGNVRWRRQLDDISGTTPFLYLTGDSVVVERRYSRNQGGARVAVEVLRREGGNRRWRKTFVADQIDVDEAGQRVVVFGAGEGRWTLRALTIADGDEASTVTAACAADDCGFGGAAARNGIGRMAGADRAAARSYLDTAAIRVDQIGIAGAWGSHYGEGEGLVLDWLPRARLIFMPWFTYSRDGGNDTSQLRWYVVQAANVPNGARSAEVEIYSVTNGAFDSAEPRITTRVGRGTLRFSDCANGSFDYVFDPIYNSGATGTITLSRLSPATQSCELADGSVQPAGGARPPGKGFDARQSGSWYEPATGGQGMQLTVQPDGVFFAAWFAYDIAGANNDGGKQHWFTLQGNLAEAVNGKIDLVVVQTLGGAFDSRATRNRYVAGQATLQMHGCDRATLTYAFADDERVGAFAGRRGELEMIKEGGCAP